MNFNYLKERKKDFKRSQSNDIIYCIKNNLVKHIGSSYNSSFDYQKAVANYLKASSYMLGKLEQ